MADEPVALHEAFHLWPENVDAFALWQDVQTQWRVGMAGPTGLDYGGVEVVLRMRGLRREVRQERFGQLQAMERVVLAEWGERRGG